MATIVAIPAQATRDEAIGMVPPLLAASIHLAFAIAMIQMETDATMRPTNNTELLGEVAAAADHWALVIRPTYINETVQDQFRIVTDQFATLRTSITTDGRDAQRRNLISQIRNIRALGVAFDHAAFGLVIGTDTDAGKNL